MPKKFLSTCKPCFLVAFFVVALSANVAAQKPLVVTGPGEGLPPVVNVFVQGLGGDDTISFLAYPKNFTGGVRVATGDVNGDGVPDLITAPGPGMGPHVRIFDVANPRRMRGRVGGFLAYGANYQGGVYVAAGDVNGDGRADIITGTDQGAAPLVRIFDGLTGKVLHSFFAYGPSFLGGVRVAAGDIDGDGKAEIITGAGPGGGPHVKVFSGGGAGELSSFFAYAPGFAGGVFVAAGDVNGDGRADIITGAGAGGGPHVKAFDANDNLNLLYSFFAFGPGFTGGVRVAVGDVNGDSINEIITAAGPGGGPHVKVFDPASQTVLHEFFAYDPGFTGGVYVAGFPAARGR